MRKSTRKYITYFSKLFYFVSGVLTIVLSGVAAVFIYYISKDSIWIIMFPVLSGIASIYISIIDEEIEKE